MGMFGGVTARRPDQRRPGPVSMLPPALGGILEAAELIIRGAFGGVFVYNASGQLADSIAGAPTTDPLTHSAVKEGITAYTPGFPGIYVRMLSNRILFSFNSLLEGVFTMATRGMQMYPPASTLTDVLPIAFMTGEPAGGVGIFSLASFIANTTPPGSPSSTKALLDVQGSAAIRFANAAGVTGTPGLVVGAPAAAGDAIVHIADDPANPRSLGAALTLWEDHTAAPVSEMASAGGFKVFSDLVSSYNGISTEMAALLPWGGVRLGGSGSGTLYSGSGAPLPAAITGALTTFGKVANAGDQYNRIDTPSTAGQRIYICTVAGNPGTWVALSV